MNILNIIKSELNTKIYNVYYYGSIVYGTFSVDSDFDFIVVSDYPENDIEFRIDEQNLNFHTYTVERFQELLNQHKISFLECFFLPDNLKIQETHTFRFQLDLTFLRKEISSVSSNSWVKCKKKLKIENEPYVGIKSLFHSLRILDFGIQIAKSGSIIDYSSSNFLWEELKNNLDTPWETLKEKYQPLKNQLNTKFRELAPKLS